MADMADFIIGCNFINLSAVPKMKLTLNSQYSWTWLDSCIKDLKMDNYQG